MHVAPAAGDGVVCTNETVAQVSLRARPRPVHRFLRTLGPGLITGAADDDPSGIGTYSATGAQFGYAQLWTALWMLPLLFAVDEASGRIGYATGDGLGAVMRSRCPSLVAHSIAGLVIAATVITIGADVGVVASAVQLLLPGPASLLTVTFTLVVLVLEVGLSYRRYSRVLKWFSLALLAYPAAVLLTNEPWPAILKATFFPTSSSRHRSSTC